MVKVVIGDILDAKEDIICHQVNCRGVMGAGVAKAISDKWPKVKQEYVSYANKFRNNPDILLGLVQLVEVDKNKFVANIFGQLDYGRYKNKRYTDYAALKSAFEYIKLAHPNKTIAFPYGFGCGLANGNWDIVKIIIDTYLDGLDVTIYKLQDA